MIRISPFHTKVFLKDKNELIIQITPNFFSYIKVVYNDDDKYYLFLIFWFVEVELVQGELTGEHVCVKDCSIIIWLIQLLIIRPLNSHRWIHTACKHISALDQLRCLFDLQMYCCK